MKRTDQPPPCDRICWELLGHPRCDPAAASWRYVLGAEHCGHYQDVATGSWLWRSAHTAAAVRPPTAAAWDALSAAKANRGRP